MIVLIISYEIHLIISHKIVLTQKILLQVKNTLKIGKKHIKTKHFLIKWKTTYLKYHSYHVCFHSYI